MGQIMIRSVYSSNIPRELKAGFGSRRSRKVTGSDLQVRLLCNRRESQDKAESRV